MKTLAFIVLGSLFVSCGGGGISSTSIPEAEACSQAATALCTKIYGCTDASFTVVKLALQTEANCKTTVLQYCGATGFTCTAGETYHGDQAQLCKDKFSAQTCATLGVAIGAGLTSVEAAIAAATANIPECGMICTGGPG